MRKKHTLKICLKHLALNKNGIAEAAIAFRPPVHIWFLNSLPSFNLCSLWRASAQSNKWICPKVRAHSWNSQWMKLGFCGPNYSHLFKGFIVLCTEKKTNCDYIGYLRQNSRPHLIYSGLVNNIFGICSISQSTHGLVVAGAGRWDSYRQKTNETI